MTDKLAKEIAKAAANHLRHDPDGLGLALDPKGWVTLEDLHFGFMTSTPHDFDVEFLEEALRSNNYKRFQFTGDRVRALSGHTTSQVKYDVAEPPEALFVTYATRHYNALHDRGIVAKRRKYLKVFSNPILAHKDAKRRRIKGGVLVSINAHRAYHDGTLFYRHDGDWYVTEVEASHLDLQEIETEED